MYEMCIRNVSVHDTVLLPAVREAPVHYVTAYFGCRRGQLHIASITSFALAPYAALYCFPACGLAPIHPTVGNAGETISSSGGRGKAVKVGDTATAAGEANKPRQRKTASIRGSMGHRLRYIVPTWCTLYIPSIRTGRSRLPPSPTGRMTTPVSQPSGTRTLDGIDGLYSVLLPTTYLHYLSSGRVPGLI
ncbi:hypothetical protein LX36DRAFT_194543 [Colletotrichum falcatum]|nr:hypothetical protein LX36DRAFT_194543 [Colletotrichum falcatum]